VKLEGQTSAPSETERAIVPDERYVFECRVETIEPLKLAYVSHRKAATPP
jgi:hypothetical protein